MHQNGNSQACIEVCNTQEGSSTCVVLPDHGSKGADVTVQGEVDSETQGQRKGTPLEWARQQGTKCCEEILEMLEKEETASSYSFTVKDIKDMPTLERQLADARAVQEKIKQTNQEIEKFTDTVNALKAAKRYRTDEEINAISMELKKRIETI